MANSYVSYAASGSTANFTITFDYLAQTHVSVQVDGVLKTFGVDYNFMSATVIHFLTGNPTAGAVIRIERDTPITTQFVNYTDGSVLVETDLDNAALQAIYLAQELQDQITDITLGALPIVAGTTNRISVASGGSPITYTVNIAATYVGQTSITTLGTIATGVWNGTAVGVAFGGTGLASYAVGDLIYASGATTLSKLADVATGNALISGGVGVAPSWGKIALTTHISGVLPVANGGTNIASYAVGDLIYASGATTLAKLADVAAGSYLRSGGVTTAPLWSTLKLPNTATAARVPYATATDTWGDDADLTFDGSTLTIGGLAGTGSRVIVSDANGVLSAPGAPWTNVAFDAANFTAESGNWTLQEADQVAFKYMIIDKTMFVTMQLESSTISATTAYLLVKVPASKTIAQNSRSVALQTSPDQSTFSAGLIVAVAGQTSFRLYKTANQNEWTAVTNTAFAAGTFFFEIS